MGAAVDRPATYDELCAVLVGRRDQLPKRLTQTATFMLSHPDDIAFGTAASIAEAAGVQPSTLVRFAQSLGFDGFSELQMLFRERLRDRTQSYEARLQAIEDENGDLDEDEKLLHGFLDASRQSLERFSQSIDITTFRGASDTLARAETLYLIARRRSFAPIIQLAYACSKLRIRHQLIGSVNGVDEDLVAMATRRDAAIIISFSPYAEQAVAHCAQLAANGVPIVAITDSAMSPLAAEAEHCFHIVEADYAAFRALSASMTLALALPVAVAERRRAASARHE